MTLPSWWLPVSIAILIMCCCCVFLFLLILRCRRRSSGEGQKAGGRSHSSPPPLACGPSHWYGGNHDGAEPKIAHGSLVVDAKAPPTACNESGLANPAPGCMMVPYPHESDCWAPTAEKHGNGTSLRLSQLCQGKLADQAKFSATATNSCRLEYEQDRISSPPSRSKPFRKKSGPVARRTSKGVNQIISTLRSSFGTIRV